MNKILDYFRKENLDEVVFEHRNKSYGAYALRVDYAHNLSRALMIGVGFFAALSIIPIVVSIATPQDHTKNPSFVPVFNLKPIDEPEKVVPNTQPVTQKIKTEASPNYLPVRNIKKDQPLPTKKDYDKAAISDVTQDGAPTTITVVSPVNVGEGISLPTQSVPATVPKEDPERLVDAKDVDVAAEFNGGINVFRQKVVQMFNMGVIDEEGLITTTITFVVEKDGSISNVKAVGANADFNREAERTVKAIKTKWKPAQLNGNVIRSSYRMPITMKIE